MNAITHLVSDPAPRRCSFRCRRPAFLRDCRAVQIDAMGYLAAAAQAGPAAREAENLEFDA
ncbi:MAG: hypothetical protein ACJ8AT_14645, partial [Hyalangium sp.]|uniref:hypothetical protein n=1 Tax=Hyalangium sp. TaxID=2028555 RepID=UPI003899E250